MTKTMLIKTQKTEQTQSTKSWSTMWEANVDYALLIAVCKKSSAMHVEGDRFE